MAKIKTMTARTGMELSHVAVQATKPKKKSWNWVVGIAEMVVAGHSSGGPDDAAALGPGVARLHGKTRRYLHSS